MNLIVGGSSNSIFVQTPQGLHSEEVSLKNFEVVLAQDTTINLVLEAQSFAPENGPQPPAEVYTATLDASFFEGNWGSKPLTLLSQNSQSLEGLVCFRENKYSNAVKLIQFLNRNEIEKASLTLQGEKQQVDLNTTDVTF